MKKCRFSIIIPAYNCSAYIQETINSVLCQLPDDCELIVVDDGSDAETIRILKQYEGTEANLIIAMKEHRGVSAARNTGLDMASGEYIAFLDCDDLLKRNYLANYLSSLTAGVDLYIFSYDRVEADGTVIPFTVNDRVYDTVSDFADEYILDRHMLIYSACNKAYRKEIIKRNRIRFREDISFGEDRLFNYDYLKHCRRILLSSRKMFDYMQRSSESASRRSFKNYYDTIFMLHKAKMDCFLSLSKGTTEEEKKDFLGYDISNEAGRMIERFDAYPDEKKENLPKINELLFGKTEESGESFDYILILGSRDCGYRVRKALDFSANSLEPVYVVSGGNLYKDGERTEAAFMAEFLESEGIPKGRIRIEDSAKNTFKNLESSAKFMKPAGNKLLKIGIVTAGFHVQRCRMLVNKIPWYRDKKVVFIPAYGEHTGLDNWYHDPLGKSIGLTEISKTAPDLFYEMRD